MARFNRVENLTLGVGKGFVLVWILVACFGSCAGWTFQKVSDVKPKDWLATWSFSWITGPRTYLSFFWGFLWIFRSCLALTYFWVNRKKQRKSCRIYFCDVCVTLLFFPVYQVVLEVYKYTGFKISGHCLLLSLALWMLRREGEVSVVILRKTWVNTFIMTILAYHYFILFFTCFAYHTFLEISAGSLLGVTLYRSIWLLVHMIPIDLT